MQKKLIALAIAGLSSAAFAQSNVTVYGVMDLTQEVAKSSGATAADGGTVAAPTGNLRSRSRLSTNSSNIGFKGSESLGNGMTAVFQAEFALSADTGGWTANGAGPFGTTANRDTFVGIAGGFGTVAAGTLTHPVRVLGAKVDNNPGASSAGFTGSMYGELIGIKSGSDERASNAVAYISPTVSGFHGVVAYVNGERAAASAQNANVTGVQGKAWQIAGVYDNGPLFVGLAYDKHTDPGVGASAYTAATGASPAAVTAGQYNDSLKITRLAATYSLPTETRLSFLWDSQKYAITSSAASNTDLKRTAYMVGVNQKFAGKNNVWLQYAVAKDPTGAICSAITCGDFGAKQWTLGYSYDLSKRTMIHALATKINNDRSVAYDHYVGAAAAANAGAGAATNLSAGGDTTVYGVGLRHSF